MDHADNRPVEVTIMDTNNCFDCGHPLESHINLPDQRDRQGAVLTHCRGSHVLALNGDLTAIACNCAMYDNPIARAAMNWRRSEQYALPGFEERP